MHGLSKQSYSDFEVIVVDDGSPRSIGEMPELQNPSFTLRIFRQENAGPAVARNTGAAQARGEFLAFTDDDCVPDAEWLETLARENEAYPDALCGSLTRNGLESSLWSSTSQLIIDLVYAHFNRNPENAYFLTSNNFSCRKSLYLEAGGFDSEFSKAGAEDRDFCDRWRLTGRPIRLVERKLLEHRHTQGLRRFLDIHYRYGRGAYLYQAKRRLRKSGTMQQDMAFHRTLWQTAPCLMPSDSRTARKMGLLAGLCLWQLANAIGFFHAMSASRHTSQ